MRDNQVQLVLLPRFTLLQLCHSWMFSNLLINITIEAAVIGKEAPLLIPPSTADSELRLGQRGQILPHAATMLHYCFALRHSCTSLLQSPFMLRIKARQKKTHLYKSSMMFPTGSRRKHHTAFSQQTKKKLS